MIESLYSPQKAPIFKETFVSEQTTRVNGGVPTSVTYSNGIGSFNGTSSKILYYPFSSPVTSVATIHSIHIRIKFNVIPGSTTTFIDTYDLSRNPPYQSYYITSTGRIADNVGTAIIVNGVAYSYNTFNATAGVWYDMILPIGTSGYYPPVSRLMLGCLYNGTAFTNCDIDLFEIYDYPLTTNEGLNVYNNKRYNGLQYSSGVSEILNVDAKNGVIQNKWNTTLTNTSTTIARDGNIWAMDFLTNGSKIDCGSYNTLLGDKTLILWAKPYYITSTTGSFNAFSNGQFILQADFGGGEAWYFSRANFGGTYLFSNNSVKENVWQMIVITSPSSGTGTIMYKNGVSITSGNIQTPVAGSAITIGNGSSSGRPRISSVRVIDGILSAAEVSQLFSNERRNYNV